MLRTNTPVAYSGSGSTPRTRHDTEKHLATFARDTEVPADRSRAEIERTLRRYGAERFAYMSAPDTSVIAFEAQGRRVRFTIPMPDRNSHEFTRTPTGRMRNSKAAVDAEWERACRQRWRALALCVKAKLEAVEAGIATFEEEFMAHIVLPDGSMVAERALPYIQQAYETGSTPPMLGFEP